jgi:cell division protein FtsW
MRTSTPGARRSLRAGDLAPSSLAAVDGGVVVSAALLVSIGIVMNYSTTAALSMGEALPPLALRHWAGVTLAVLCAGAAAWTPLVFWKRLALPAYGITTLLLVLTPLVGLEANGATRWLAIPGLPLSLQPAEPARFATVLALAAILARASERGEPRPESLRTAVALLAIPTFLLLLQPDLGSAIVTTLVAASVLFAAGFPLRRLGMVGALGIAGAGAYVAVRPYAAARLRGFLDPWMHAQDEGFQLVQSFVAFGRGGALGVGIGDGRQKLFYLPEAHTDFILSVVAEELGFVGVLVVLGAFAALALAGLRIAARARDPYALLLATGMTCFIVLPAAINAAVVMGLLPTTGLTLPFLSHGSNSLVCCAAAIGILVRIGTQDPDAPLHRSRGRERWSRA